MNKSTIRIIVAVLVILLFIPSLIAQDKVKEDTPYWENSYYKMNGARIDSLKKLDKKYVIPVVAEAKKRGLILEFHTLIHHTGDEYNLIFMTKLSSWAALEKIGFGRHLGQSNLMKINGKQLMRLMDGCLMGV